jgi:hypothetical protein
MGRRTFIEPARGFPFVGMGQPIGIEKELFGRTHLWTVGRSSHGSDSNPTRTFPVVVLERAAPVGFLIYDELGIDLYQLTFALYFMANVRKRRRSARKFRTIKPSSQLKSPF